MIAAQKFNRNTDMDIFGIVTTGNFWQFGKLRKNILTMEVISFSAVDNLQKLFNILNWIIIVAKKNIALSVNI